MKTHIEQITSKMSKAIGIISSIKHILPKYILHTLSYTMIYPYLHYCNIVWASTYPSRLEKLVASDLLASREFVQSSVACLVYL